MGLRSRPLLDRTTSSWHFPIGLTPYHASTKLGPMAAEMAEPVEQLLNRWFQNRDRDALDTLLAENLPYLQRYAHSRMAPKMRAKHDTNDLIQDAVVDFLHYSPPFEISTQAQLRGLLCKIVDRVVSGQHRWFARMCRDVAREQPLAQGTSLVFQPIPADGPSPSGVARDQEREAAIRLALTTLAPLDQQIVMLRIYRDLEFSKIGEEIDMQADAVRKRCSRALASLSRKLLAWKQGDFDGYLG